MCHYSLRSIANVSLDDFATGKPNLGRGFVFLYFILISQVLSRSIIKNIISLPSIWQSFDKTINRLLVGWENYLCSFTAIYCFFSELSSYILLQKKTTFDLKAFSLLTLLSNFMQQRPEEVNFISTLFPKIEILSFLKIYFCYGFFHRFTTQL